jgi:hypothetical protein
MQRALTESSPASRGTLLYLLAVTLAALLSSGCVGLTGSGGDGGSSLTATPSSIGFGDVSAGSQSFRSVTVTNTGAAGVSVGNVAIAGPGFSASGVPAGLTLAPGETVALSVTFAPAGAGAVTGKVTVVEQPFPHTLGIALSGTGVTPSAHSVTLTWNASTSNVAGYRAYRATSPSGPYAALSSSPNPQLRWTDSSVQAGTTYYYVVTAVTADSVESAYSNQAAAAIPKP